MSRKFNVGDRVRIVKSRTGALIGHTGTITRGLHRYFDPYKREYGDGYNIDVDGIGPVRPETGRKWIAPPDWIVPLYDGGDPAKWADCAWQPNKARA